MSAGGPRVVENRILYQHPTMHLYHPDFSPDGSYVTFSYGPGGRVPASGPGTHTQVAEMVGVRGPWDIYLMPVEGGAEPINLTDRPELSNKESDWLRVGDTP